MASRVTLMREALSAFSKTSTQREKTSANSWHFFREDSSRQRNVSRTSANRFSLLHTHDLGLERLGLCCCHLLGREFENFFREKFQDDHVVLADREVCLRRGHNLGDERRPVVRPKTINRISPEVSADPERESFRTHHSCLRICTRIKFSLFK